jgi:phytanoyl-CoA hydroxylase
MLTQTEISRYHRDGQITAPVQLPEQTVREIRHNMEGYFARQPGADQDYAANLIDKDLSWLKYAQMPQILDTVSALIGDDIIVWGSALFAKKAIGGKATPWHQDGHYWPIRPLATVTAWIAIDDVNTDNGCLRVLPGSHESKTLFAHDRDDSGEGILNQALDIDRHDFQPARDVVLPPGAFSIHDVYLVHGAEPNNSGRRRGGLVFRYMPASSVFDRGLAAEQVRAMGVPDISKRHLYLVRGVDRSGKNDIFQIPETGINGTSMPNNNEP